MGLGMGLEQAAMGLGCIYWVANKHFSLIRSCHVPHDDDLPNFVCCSCT